MKKNVEKSAAQGRNGQSCVNFLQKAKLSFFRIQRLSLKQKKQQILMSGLEKNAKNLNFGNFGQKGQFWSVLTKMGQTRFIKKSLG